MEQRKSFRRSGKVPEQRKMKQAYLNDIELATLIWHFFVRDIQCARGKYSSAFA